MNVLFRMILLLLVLAAAGSAQSTGCEIAGIKFACPSEYYKEMKSTDPATRIFKYTEGNVYFFMTAPSARFDAARLA